ncbi:MAG TPA: CheR family methyltransferase [Candidatus Elarobacter sp.]
MSDAGSESEQYLVVTGSSAGGIDALMAFLGGIPADFGGSIIVAQHQAPAHTSRLSEILRSKSELPVRSLDARTVLEPGTVYVVGSDRDVEVLDGAASPVERSKKGPKPSIDRLFTTASDAYGDRLIAIVFSGMGSDGLAGARVVKEHGGTVIVQEFESATFPHMPMAIPPNLVDITARPEAMGAVLTELVNLPLAPRSSGDQNVLRTLLVLLRERSGVDFTQYKTPTIVRRLARLMVAAGVNGIAEYVRYLQIHPEAYQRTINAFLIKVTEFFRDGELFQELGERILPQLLADARERGTELRIWSAGTSTGEEAYSVAILCAELLRESGDDVGVRIFATDLDEQAVTFARRGLYSPDALRRLPPGLLERYFIRAGDTFEVTKRIRNMTVFGQHDLGQRAPFPRIDLCLCRNVLIYFTKDLQSRALQLFAFSLRDGGYLIVGKAESTGALAQYFRVVDSALKIYQRQGERNLIPPAPLKELHPLLALAPSERTGRAALPNVHQELRTAAGEALGPFAVSTSIGVVVVDRRYDVAALNAPARTMLELHGVGVGEDLLHMVRNVDAAPLRGVIDAAFNDEPLPPLEIAVREPADGAERWLLVSAGRVRSPAGPANDRAALFVVDVTPSAGRRRELERTCEEEGARLVELTARLEELSRRQRALLQANAQLTDGNAELRNANEQLLIVAEEAASANEEIETLNEEMQATNEELETLNEELQATVEELNTSNDELEARGGDLEELAGARQMQLDLVTAQRDTMARVIEASAGPLVLLRPDETVLYASPSLDRNGFVGLAPGWSQGSRVRVDDGKTYSLSPYHADGLPFVVLQVREEGG